MDIAFVVPGALDQLTGGYLFDRQIVEGLRRLRRAVAVHELPGSFPEADPAAQRAGASLLASLPDGTAVVIDGLALPAFVESLPAHALRLRLIGFVHHPLALETGLALQRREALALIEARLLPRLQGVICPSRTTAWHVEEYGVPRERIAVVSPGTDKPAAERPTRAAGPLRLLSVGTLTPRKGHLVLIEALGALADRPWQLTCIGSLTRSPETVRAIERAIADRGLADRVTLAGEWPRERLPGAYAAADIFVLPSFHEGYGMAFADALAHGLPIIATTAGAIPETVPSEAGLLVPPGDRDALERALAMIIDNARLRLQLAAGAARAGAALPDWPQAVARWVAAFDRLLEAAAGTGTNRPPLPP
jgi:glycosyltransferase involved in cell wall biosynthesis